jgi:predicted transcriptional regulator
MWMAAAGPLTSLLIGAFATLTGALLVGNVGTTDPRVLMAAAGPVATLLLWLGPVNIMLALFNMVPGFPLDGGRVLRAALWRATGDLDKATRWAALAGNVFGWTLIAMGLLMTFGLWIPLLGTGFVGGLWLMLIGWFLSNAATSSYQQLRVREALVDVPVRALMRSRLVGVSPATTVDALVSNYFMNSDQRAFPVMEDGELLGLVSMNDVSTVPRHNWRFVNVAQIMTSVDSLDAMAPSDPAFAALERLRAPSVDPIPIVEAHQLLGLVRREDIARWLTLSDALAAH